MQVQCPQCSSTLNAPETRAGQVVKCPKCGAEMQLPQQPGIPAGPAASEAPTKRCPACGESILSDARKCRFCGEILDPTMKRTSVEGAAALAAYQRGMRIMSTVLYVLGALVLLGGICGVIGMSAATNSRAAGVIGVLMVVMLVVGGLYLLMGYFARKYYPWTNWVIAILTGLSVLGNLVNVASGRGAGQGVLGAVIAAALMILAISNLVKLSAVRAANLDPTATSEKGR